MSFQFCPHCGTKLQEDFRFCPSCGKKFPPASACSAPQQPAGEPAPPLEASPGPPGPGAPRASRAKARTPAAPKRKDVSVGPDSPPPLAKKKKPPTPVKGKGRGRSLRGQKVEEEEEEEEEEETETDDPPTGPSPFFRTPPGGGDPGPAPGPPGPPPVQTSPQKDSWRHRRSLLRHGRYGGRGAKAASARRVSAVTPLQEGEELTDTAGRKWRLGKLLSQTETELVYEAFASNAQEAKHILKLGAKDGRIFNEQNFLQRAAKASSVDKWIKSSRLDFLGLPSCVGFGLHAASYRFLIFPSMGQTLLSVLETTPTLPTERTVLQMACRILDVLTFIHSNEYVHGDINAENVYVSAEGPSQVFLAGYSHAFRYRPGGQQVAYREASRTPHDGALGYISVDAHKGAGLSPRSDLQSLAYCLLHWLTGALPWDSTSDPQAIGSQKQRFLQDVPALLSSCSAEKSVSSAVQQYVTTVMALGYTDTPDYQTLRAGLHDALLQLGGALERPLCAMTASCS